MEPPMSPIVANLYVENFKVKVLVHHPTQACGKDMWMMLLWLSKQHITVGSWNASPP